MSDFGEDNTQDESSRHMERANRGANNPRASDARKMGNWMLVELEWQPSDKIELPEVLSAYFHSFGEPVIESGEVFSRQDVHLDPPADDCNYHVSFESGQQLCFDPVEGWVATEGGNA